MMLCEIAVYGRSPYIHAAIPPAQPRPLESLAGGDEATSVADGCTRALIGTAAVLVEQQDADPFLHQVRHELLVPMPA